MMLVAQIILPLIAVVLATHLLAGRVPDFIFSFLPAFMVAPFMEFAPASLPAWISAITSVIGVGFGIYAFTKWRFQTLSKTSIDGINELRRKVSELESRLVTILNPDDGRRRKSLQGFKLFVHDTMAVYRTMQEYLTDEESTAVLEALRKSKDLHSKAEQGIVDGDDIDNIYGAFKNARDLLFQRVKV